MEETLGNIELNYYEPHVGERNVEILQKELSKIGSLRSRRFIKDLGGESPDLMIAVQWVGLTVLGGVVQHLTAKYYEKFLVAINNYSQKSRIDNPDFHPFATVTFSYDDLDVEITLPNTTNIDFFDKIMKKIMNRIALDPLKSKNVVKISMPYYFDESEKLWMQTFDWSQVNYESRYWAIGTHTAYPNYIPLEDIYDSEENRLLKAPVENIV